MKPIWLIGAGGHAKVVIDTLRASRAGEVAGILDDDRCKWGGGILGIPIVGDASPGTVARLGVERAIVAIGSNRIRDEVSRRLSGRIEWETAVHPSAYLATGVRLREGAVVFAGAVIQPDTDIGPHAIINTASSIDHDCVIGPCAHIGPGVRLAGGVHVGPGVLMGIASCVIPGRSVGAWATVGAGSVVVRDIPPGVTARGVPARYSPG